MPNRIAIILFWAPFRRLRRKRGSGEVDGVVSAVERGRAVTTCASRWSASGSRRKGSASAGLTS